MITYKTKKHNIIKQDIYDKHIESLQRHKIKCSCGHLGCLIIHGYYIRKIKTPFGKIALRIVRLLCKECGKTHAVLPDSIVPYSQITIEDHILILRATTKEDHNKIMEDNLCIDESNISYIKRNYKKHWKERLRTYKISLDYNLTSLCLLYYKRQFMQIKCTINLLYTFTHTA